MGKIILHLNKLKWNSNNKISCSVLILKKKTTLKLCSEPVCWRAVSLGSESCSWLQWKINFSGTLSLFYVYKDTMSRLFLSCCFEPQLFPQWLMVPKGQNVLLVTLTQSNSLCEIAIALDRTEKRKGNVLSTAWLRAVWSVDN